MDPAPDPGPARPSSMLVIGGVVAVAVAAVAVIALVAAVVLPGLTTSPGSPAPSEGTTGVTSSGGPSVAPPSLAPAPSARPSTPTRPAPVLPPQTDRPIASSGAVVVQGVDGSLRLVDADGRSMALAVAPDVGAFVLPTWSPDGSRIAAIRATPTSTSIVVFDAERTGAAGPGDTIEPVEIFRSATVAPFYLFWTPDARSVTFLATEAGVLGLRMAPADGSAPLDGSAPGAMIGTGNPFYYDWLTDDRLLAHVGTGPGAFLGEVEIAGDLVREPLAVPGDFRPPAVNHDRRSIAYVRADRTGSEEVVVAAADGSSERAVPVYGSAAVAFDPTGDRIASIGPSEPGASMPAFPLGPLRLIDAATRTVDTLIDGLVGGFWWSPDGTTIAALTVTPAVAAGPTPRLFASPTPAPRNEIRLVFVDVASGETRSESIVDAAPSFVNLVLAYFDQYALSHELWSPDSSSFLLPEAIAGGGTRVTVYFANGEPPIALEGQVAFWSP